MTAGNSAGQWSLLEIEALLGEVRTIRTDGDVHFAVTDSTTRLRPLPRE